MKRYKSGVIEYVYETIEYGKGFFNYRFHEYNDTLDISISLDGYNGPIWCVNIRYNMSECVYSESGEKNDEYNCVKPKEFMLGHTERLKEFLPDDYMKYIKLYERKNKVLKLSKMKNVIN